jgi:hypothetical protein
LAGRFYDFGDPPLDFHPTRQFYSMLMARGMYYENLEELPDELREQAIIQWQSEAQIEPQIMQRLSAWGYHLVGSVDLGVPRFLSIFFWTLGAVGLFLVSRDLVGSKGAVIGVAYFMLLPYTLYASRSFQPEPLMTASIIWSWWGMVRWINHKRWVNAVIAGLLIGVAIYVKLPAVFFVFPALVALVLTKFKIREAIKNPQLILIALLSILPALIYHIDGFFISGFLKGQQSLRFFPDLLIDPFHYLNWKDMIDSTLGIEFFLLAVVGILMIKSKPFRVMFLWIFIGYFLYGTVFDYHIVTHSYYQIPLTPVIAVGLAACFGTLIENIKGRKVFALLLIGGVTFFWMAYNFWDARMTLKHSNYADEPDFYESLGAKLKDYTVVSITPNYGYRLSYWGWKQTINWKSVGDFTMREMAGVEVDREAEFEKATENSDLFLITDFEEFNQQPDVKQFLMESYSIFEEGDGYLIYDLREPVP